MAMREGMLWFDNSEQRELNGKIERAAQFYQTKYGSRPTLCFVHPTMLLQGPATLDGIEVRATNSVLPNHFWLGVLSNNAIDQQDGVEPIRPDARYRRHDEPRDES